MEEIEKFMNCNNASLNYRYINIGGKSLYVEGIKSVVEFGESKMQFQLKKCVLEVVGQNLKVKYLDKTTAVIIGEIFSVVAK